jgi:hypothetical protein
MKKYKWWFKFPTQFYANDLDFNKPVDEATARKEMRSWLGVKKLPPGTQVW